MLIRKLVIEGFINGYQISSIEKHKKIFIFLKNDRNGQSIIKELNLVSKLERDKIFKEKQIKSYRNNLAEFFFSSKIKTNNGKCLVVVR